MPVKDAAGGETALKRILVGIAVLTALVLVSAARAEVVQEFQYELRDLKPYGAFTVVFTLRSYDTTGAVPPPLRSAFLRLPAGARIRHGFFTRRFLCNVKKLNETKDPKVCKHAEVGRGSVLVDARPFTSDAIPAKIFLFFARGTVKKAVASIAILGIPDDSAPVVRNNPFIKESKVVLSANFFDDTTADGKYGYKLVLPTGPIRGVDISVAEVNVTIPGLTLTKRERTCMKMRRGRCVKTRVRTKKIYWFTVPKCPSSGKYSFEAVFEYTSAQRTTRTVGVPCPNFRR
jgi:hypothetical protein